MQFCILGSGSRGNAAVVEHRGTTLLLDCGFTLPDIKRRLARRTVNPCEIDAVIVGHEHADHCKGLRRFLRETGAPAYMTAGTAQALAHPPGWREIFAGKEFGVGEMHVFPFAVPHDAAEPVQFVVGDGARRAAFVTDLGFVPPQLLEILHGLSAIVLECNYDAKMLAANRNYPQKIKDRISGGLGHLENSEAAALLAAAHHKGMRHIVAAHLSEQNNTPAAALRALSAAVGKQSAKKIKVADQTTGINWLAL